ncbi:MAG: T9SS type A sorting domain-containing protein, partial [Bacteroidales bacterium]|nr:T9SS type A sorting domain-containing protein [Bacteroidales bacterium]
NSMKSSSPKQILFISENIVVVNTGTNGIFAVDLGDTPLDFSDDQAVVRQIVSGGARVGTVITSMMLSQSGSLYVGTDKGVAYTLTPESLVEGGAGFIRPISTETNDRDGSYSQYLLSSKTVTCIAEDAAGRKWFGTKSAGVFVVNEDCDEEVMRFNVRNSPLPSDTIIALEIVQNTGEVFMATANGLASYISDAQKSADDLDNILVYPNPVRPGYDGDIHISGLESGSDVRITDIAGHLVHKATSDSGLLSWDGNNLNGRRCASGVYLIFVFNVETGDKKVKKLLIIR